MSVQTKQGHCPDSVPGCAVYFLPPHDVEAVDPESCGLVPLDVVTTKPQRVLKEKYPETDEVEAWLKTSTMTFEIGASSVSTGVKISSSSVRWMECGKDGITCKGL